MLFNHTDIRLKIIEWCAHVLADFLDLGKNAGKVLDVIPQVTAFNVSTIKGQQYHIFFTYTYNSRNTPTDWLTRGARPQLGQWSTLIRQPISLRTSIFHKRRRRSTDLWYCEWVRRHSSGPWCCTGCRPDGWWSCRS